MPEIRRRTLTPLRRKRRPEASLTLVSDSSVASGNRTTSLASVLDGALPGTTTPVAIQGTVSALDGETFSEKLWKIIRTLHFLSIRILPVEFCGGRSFLLTSPKLKIYLCVWRAFSCCVVIFRAPYTEGLMLARLRDRFIMLRDSDLLIPVSPIKSL